jgi:hypothetical protein
MSVFTIDTDNNITVHPHRKAARQSGAGIFDTAANFAELIGADNKRMVEIWNGLTDVTPVRKFPSRTVAAERIFAEVQKLAAPDGGATTDQISGGSGDGTRKAKHTPGTGTAEELMVARKASRKKEAQSKTGSKKEILLSLTSREQGASLEELMAALGWQKHSVRGFLATLGKTVNIESFKTAQGVRTYRSAQA